MSVQIGAFAQSPDRKKVPGKAPALKPQRVEVIKVRKKAIQSVSQLVGTVESPRISDVSSEV